MLRALLLLACVLQIGGCTSLHSGTAKVLLLVLLPAMFLGWLLWFLLRRGRGGERQDPRIPDANDKDDLIG